MILKFYLQYIIYQYQSLLENVQITQRIKQAEEQANNHNNFFMELNTKQRKFDFIAKYLSKGIFKMDS